MITAQVRILPTERQLSEMAGEDWGEWHFSSLPRAGDHIDLTRSETTELLRVERVIHFAVQHPMPRSETPFRQRKAPTICILAVRTN